MFCNYLYIWGMKELMIYEYQAKEIQDALRIAIRVLDSRKKETCLDRSLMRAKEYIDDVISKEPISHEQTI